MKIRRIIVGLQAAPSNRAMLEAAAAYAAHAEAELVGLFVESVDLLHFAGLPFAHEVGAGSAGRRALDVSSMERSLRLAAKEAREMLASVASGADLRWSFTVKRGVVATELLAVADESDLLLVCSVQPNDLHRPHVQVIHAQYPHDLHAALQSAAGAVVIAGDEKRVGEALRILLSADQAQDGKRTADR